jgi:hypothetical protein
LSHLYEIKSGVEWTLGDKEPTTKFQKNLLAADFHNLGKKFVFYSHLELTTVFDISLHVKACWPLLLGLLLIVIVCGSIYCWDLILEHKSVVIRIQLRGHETANLVRLINYRTLLRKGMLILNLRNKFERLDSLHLENKGFSSIKGLSQPDVH